MMLLRLLVVSKLGDTLRQTHLGAAPSGLPESNLTPQPPGLLPWSRRFLFCSTPASRQVALLDPAIRTLRPIFEKVRGTPVGTKWTRHHSVMVSQLVPREKRR